MRQIRQPSQITLAVREIRIERIEGLMNMDNRTIGEDEALAYHNKTEELWRYKYLSAKDDLAVTPVPLCGAQNTHSPAAHTHGVDG